MPESELTQFLDETTDDVMNSPLAPAPAKEEVQEESSDEEESPKNRRERRLQERLQAEREANIALQAKLQTISEAQQFRSENEGAEYLKSVERIYGTNSPEAIEATNILKGAFQTLEERAKKSALEAFREEQRLAAEQVRKEEERLDSIVEDIEDRHNVSLTSDQQKGFFKLMEKMSPKDAQGNITDYADPDAVWEIYAERLQKGTDQRAKTLASRSMTQSGASQGNNQGEAFKKVLRDAGII
jgi:hypothetical protein